jgi:uncharacterized GH25 family protein
MVLGYPAEMVPLVNPYELSVGDEMQVRCLVDGAPVANQYVRVGGQVGELAFTLLGDHRTDAEGIVRFNVDAPGKYWLEAINMAPSPLEDIDYESKWATLTFEIR